MNTAAAELKRHARVKPRPEPTARANTLHDRSKEALCRYELLAQHSRDAILFIKREDGRILEANLAATAMYGYSRKELLKLTIQDLRAASTKKLTAKQMSSADTSGLLFETIHRRKDGRTFPVEVSSRGADFDGCRTLISVIRDITERRQAQEALEHSERQLRLFVEHAPAAMAMFDREMRYMVASRRWLAEYGLEDRGQDIVGRNLYEVCPELPERWRETLRRSLTGSVEKNEEEAFTRADGGVDWIRWEARPWQQASGEIGGIVLFTELITERKQAQKALHQSEQRYRRLVELCPDAIIVHRNSRIEFVNAAAIRLMGATTAEQIHGKSPYDIFDPEYHAVIRERIGQLRQGQSTPLIDEKLVRLDGERVDVEVTASPFVDQNGPAIQVIVHDATERKQKEEQRRRLNRTLNALNNSNQALLHASDEAALLERVCRIITQDCGYAMVWIGFAESDANKTVRPVAHAGFEDGYLDTLRITWDDSTRGLGPTGSAIRTGVTCACRNMPSDPKMEPWRKEALKRGYASSLAIPLSKDGAAFGAITIYAREPDPFSDDEIKLLAELAADLSYGIGVLRFRAAHERVQEALRQSEERLRVAATAANIGVWNWNPQTGEVVVSANWKRLFGVEADAPVTFDTWHNALHPEDRERAVSALVSAKEQRQEYNVEFRIVLPDGDVRWIVARGRGAYDDNGQALNMAGVNVDITERKRAETALVRSEKLASVGRMAMSIAHEINNPLAAVMNTLFLARSSADLAPAARQHLDVADSELKRVALITRQALGFYREQSVPEIVSVGEIVDSAIDLLQSRIQAKHATINRRYEGDLHITTIAGELRQVICNLLANSLDAIGDNGLIRIHAFHSHCVQEGKRCMRVTVADNGKGIPRASRPHIFEALYTTKDSTGTGLGLWITKQIVERHGGSIRFRSIVNGATTGTVFSILLPCKNGAR